MTQAFNHSGIYAIIDDSIHSKYGLVRLWHDIIEQSDIPVIQLRLKILSPAQKIKLVQSALQIKCKRNFMFIINDDLQLIKDCLPTQSVATVEPQHGIHLGQDDAELSAVRAFYPHMIVGISTHNVKEALRAEQAKADYIGCGAVFPTKSKDNTQALGLQGLTEIVNAVTIPTVAIGGIGKEQIMAVAQTGCHMAACISGLIAQNKFRGQELHELFLKHQIINAKNTN